MGAQAWAQTTYEVKRGGEPRRPLAQERSGQQSQVEEEAVGCVALVEEGALAQDRPHQPCVCEGMCV
jgi:hypothetical protein